MDSMKAAKAAVDNLVIKTDGVIKSTPDNTQFLPLAPVAPTFVEQLTAKLKALAEARGATRH